MSSEPKELFSGLMRQILHLQRLAKSEAIDPAYGRFLKGYAVDDPNDVLAATLACYAASSNENWLSHIAGETLDVIDAVEGVCANYETTLSKMAARISELEKHVQPERRQHPISDATVRDAVWALTQGKCAYCDTDIKRDGQAESRGVAFCVEHVVPTSAGGPDNLANYVPACISCNSSKGDRHVLMLLRRMQRRPELTLIATKETG